MQTRVRNVVSPCRPRLRSRWALEGARMLLQLVTLVLILALAVVFLLMLALPFGS